MANKEEKLGLGRKIKDTFKEWCMSSTSHGLKIVDLPDYKPEINQSLLYFTLKVYQT